MKLRFFQDARILIVDDNSDNIFLLGRILLEGGYTNIESVQDPRQALSMFTTFGPDIVLLDLKMPEMDGFDVMEQLQAQMADESPVPIVVLTADLNPESRRRALSRGAKEFLTKPFDPLEVRLRIMNLLEMRFLQMRLRHQNRILREEVRDRITELEESRFEILQRLAVAAEYRDYTSAAHSQRVGRTAGLLARRLGLPEPQVSLITRAAPLHDIGKLGIPDSILLKPGKLTWEEFEVAKQHTLIGARILSGSQIPLLQLAEEISLTHHERWDGTGYSGLAGDSIPLVGRIVALADVFDALTSERPYKHAWTVEMAIEEVIKQSGKQFDPDVVGAFEKIHSERDLREGVSGPVDLMIDLRVS